MTQIAGGVGFIPFASLWGNAYENWYLIGENKKSGVNFSRVKLLAGGKN